MIFISNKHENEHQKLINKIEFELGLIQITYYLVM